MNAALLIARRDLADTLHSFTGYVIIAAVLFIDGILFNAFALGSGAQYSHAVLQQFFHFCSGTTMIAALLITMRSFAAEHQDGTQLLLDQSPISSRSVVFGKYLAAMGLLAIMTLLTLYMPLLILVNGKISLGHIAVGYIGMLSLGSACAAIGIFSSALFRNAVSAAIFSGVIVVGLLLCWLLSEISDAPFKEVFAYMALFDKHFTPFKAGRLLTSGLVFYGSVTAAFLMLTSTIQEWRTWK
jgi:ABC-2 type transport system permease protein